jgi:endonuclease/exonuclease/phosphatase family metal-dependent hydrolase
MPPFPKPLPHRYSVEEQIRALRAHRRARAIPPRTDDSLLLASWNIANLGVQERRDSDYSLIAEILSWFDVVAIQEVNEDLRGLHAILRHLSSRWLAIFTDRSGNNERLAYLYRSDRIAHGELLGEVNLLPSERRRVRVKGIPYEFGDFNRSPALCSFHVNGFRFTLANVHVYYGSASGAKFQRRLLEVMALAVYARSRQGDRTRYDGNLMLVGDFNTPKADRDDPIFSALLRAGMVAPHSLPATKVGGRTLGFEKEYDQLLMFPDTRMRSRAVRGVFDWDSVIFPELWDDTDRERQRRFFDYIRYYISDHRLLWTRLTVPPH